MSESKNPKYTVELTYEELQKIMEGRAKEAATASKKATRVAKLNPQLKSTDRVNVKEWAAAFDRDVKAVETKAPKVEIKVPKAPPKVETKAPKPLLSTPKEFLAVCLH